MGMVTEGLSLAMDAYSLYQGETDPTTDILSGILASQERIEQALGHIYKEIKWGNAASALTQPVLRIGHLAGLLKTYSLATTPEPSTIIEPWATAVMNGDNDGMSVHKALSDIDQVINGVSGTTEPIMETYLDKVESSSTTQSQHYEGVEFFRALVEIQVTGLMCLTNAAASRVSSDKQTAARNAVEFYTGKHD